MSLDLNINLITFAIAVAGLTRIPGAIALLVIRRPCWEARAPAY